MPLTIVMPGLVYGPGDTSGMHTALVDLLRGRLPMTPARTAFCWAHIEDTARGHILAMEKGKPGETYIIAGPRHTFEYAFDLAASIAQGPRADVASRARTRCAPWRRPCRCVGRFVTLPPAFTPEALRVLAGTTYFGSNEKAIRELGFCPASPRRRDGADAEHELRADRLNWEDRSRQSVAAP